MSPGVLHLGVERHAVLLARQHLAEPADAEQGRVVLADGGLEGLAEPREVVGHARELVRAAAALEVIAAQEVRVLVGHVAEARHVRRDRPAVVEGGLGADARRDEAAAPGAHDVLAQVAAQEPRRVAHALGVPRRLRVEKDARAVQAARAQDHDLGLEVHHLACVGVDHAHAARLARGRVEEHLGNDRVGPDGQVAGVARGVDERGRRVEGGVDVAPAPAPASSQALRPVLVVEDAVGGHARAAGDVAPAHLCDGALEGDLHAVELARALEDPVRHLLQAFVRAGAAEEHVHLVVVGLDVVVGDRPVDVEAVAAGRAELHRPVAQRAAAPEVRLPSQHARPHPGVGRARGRVLLLVHHPVAGEGVAAVRRHRLVLGQLGVVGVGPVEEVVLGHRDRTVIRGHAEPARGGVGPLHRPVLLAVVEHAPGFQHQHLHAGHRELERGHPAGGAAAHDDHVPARGAGLDRGGEAAGLVGDGGEVEVEGGIGRHVRPALSARSAGNPCRPRSGIRRTRPGAGSPCSAAPCGCRSRRCSSRGWWPPWR